MHGLGTEVRPRVSPSFAPYDATSGGFGDGVAEMLALTPSS